MNSNQPLPENKDVIVTITIRLELAGGTVPSEIESLFRNGVVVDAEILAMDERILHYGDAESSIKVVEG